MAKFTEQLNPGQAMEAPAKIGGISEGLPGLLNTAATEGTALAENYTGTDAASEQANLINMRGNLLSATASANARQTKDLNETILGYVNQLAGAESSSYPSDPSDVAGTSTAPQLPSSSSTPSATPRGGSQGTVEAFQQRAAGLRSTLAAEKSGRLPAGSTDLAVEGVLVRELRNHPEQAYNIMKAYHSLGIDHYLFRDYQANMQAEDAADADRRAVDSSAYDLGVKAGVSPDDRDGAILAGRNIQIASSNLEQLKNIKSTSDIQQASLNHTKTVALKGFVTAVMEPQIQTLVQAFNTAATNGDASFAQATKDLVPRVNAAMQSMKAAVAARAPALGVKDLSEINSYINTYQQVLTNMVSGKASDFQMQHQQAVSLNDKLKIDNSKLYPLVTRMKSAFGSNWMQTMQPVLSNPAMVKALQQEIVRSSPDDILSGRTGLSVVDMVEKAGKGSMPPIHQIPASQAQSVISGVTGGFKGASVSLTNKTDTSYTNQQRWVNYSSTLLEAMSSMSANTGQSISNPNAVHSTAANFFNPMTRGIMEDFIRHPGGSRETGEQLMLNSRTTAVSMLQMMKGQTYGSYGLTFDPKSNSFTVTKGGKLAARPTEIDTVAYGSESLMSIGYSYNGGQLLAAQYDKAKSAADTANLLLQHMIQTDKYDESIPKNASQRSRLVFWAEGGNQRALRDNNGKPLYNPEETTQPRQPTAIEALNKFTENVSKLPGQMDRLAGVASATQAEDEFPKGRQYYAPFVSRAERQYGLPRGLLDRVITQESNYDPSASNPTSSAHGIAQFIKGTAQERGVDPSDPYASIEGAAAYLKELHDQYGSWEAAVDAYGTTASSNFGGDKKAAEAVKRKVVGNVNS